MQGVEARHSNKLAKKPPTDSFGVLNAAVLAATVLTIVYFFDAGCL